MKKKEEIELIDLDKLPEKKKKKINWSGVFTPKTEPSPSEWAYNVTYTSTPSNWIYEREP